MPARKTTKQIDDSIKHRNISRIGNYAGIDTPIEWKCNDCANIWNASPNNIINKFSGCPCCSAIKAGKKKSAGQLDRVTNVLKI